MSYNTELHKKDFSMWSLETAELIRNNKFNEVDSELVADEISAWHSDDAMLLSRNLSKVISALLKYAFAHDLRARLKPHWYSELAEARIMISSILDSSPSLREKFIKEYKSEYEYSVFKAYTETGVPESKFPKKCPWMIDQILDTSFYPYVSKIEDAIKIKSVQVSDEYLTVELSNDMVVSIPVAWYEWLQISNAEQRNDSRIVGEEDEIIWPLLGNKIISLYELLLTK